MVKLISTVSYSSQNQFLAKKRVRFGFPEVWTHDHTKAQFNAQPLNHIMFRDNSHNSIIMLLLNMIMHIIKN